MPYRIISILCFIALCVEALTVVFRLFFQSRSQKIAFLRSFKRGKCAFIFATALPIYFIGHLYSGEDIFASVFQSIEQVGDLVTLGYETGGIEKLMAAEPIYYATIYLCYFLVTINAIIFALSLTHQYIWRWWHEKETLKSQGAKLFIFGKGQNNIDIYTSCNNSEKKLDRIMIADFSKEEQSELYLEGICYASTADYEKYSKKILGGSLNSEHIVIINTGSDDSNILIAKNLSDGINKMANGNIDPFGKIKVFVFGDQRYETIYIDIVTNGLGCIHYVNKYQMIATRFIDEHPFTKYMTSEQIDYESATIRKGIDINALFIGFGKTGQQIFLTSVANNQFITMGKSGVELKIVNYCIFDKEDSEKNKNLNHGYFRYEQELSGVSDKDYLPLPALPTPSSDDMFRHLDINDPEFYKNIRAVVTKNPQDVNFAVIAFGTDLENIDMAQKLIEKRKEWGVKNLVIFVKVRRHNGATKILSGENCFVIANEKESVYNIDTILGDSIHKMANLRNQAYDLESDMAKDRVHTVDENYVKQSAEKSMKKWYVKKSQLERESSLYCCLSLRSKLHMIGLDYQKSTGKGMSQDKYLLHYAADDKPSITRYDKNGDIKPVVSYTIDFKDSKRTKLAIHEHLRWNSFMISKGIVPASISNILNEKDDSGEHTNGKNYALRRHGNLTTYEGLVRFRKMVAERDGCPEEQVDVIKYDYQLLDDAHWLLSKCGYEIIEKENL